MTELVDRFKTLFYESLEFHCVEFNNQLANGNRKELSVCVDLNCSESSLSASVDEVAQAIRAQASFVYNLKLDYTQNEDHVLINVSFYLPF